MQYREDLVKLFQDWVNEHSSKIYFTGYCNNGLPERICHTDYILTEDSIKLQSLYLEYLQNTLGEYSIFGNMPYAVEFFVYTPVNFDLLIQRKESNYGNY